MRGMPVSIRGHACDAATKTLVFSAQSSKILEASTARRAINLSFSPENWQAATRSGKASGQGGVDLDVRG